MSTATFGMRPTGMPSSSSWRMGCSDVPERASISFTSARTVSCSPTWPMVRTASTVPVKAALSGTCSFRTPWKPSREKVTAYSPGRRSTTR